MLTGALLCPEGSPGNLLPSPTRKWSYHAVHPPLRHQEFVYLCRNDSLPVERVAYVYSETGDVHWVERSPQQVVWSTSSLNTSIALCFAVMQNRSYSMVKQTIAYYTQLVKPAIYAYVPDLSHTYDLTPEVTRVVWRQILTSSPANQRGQYLAFNDCLHRFAQHDWILYVDPDDWLRLAVPLPHVLNLGRHACNILVPWVTYNMTYVDPYNISFANTSPLDQTVRPEAKNMASTSRSLAVGIHATEMCARGTHSFKLGGELAHVAHLRYTSETVTIAETTPRRSDAAAGEAMPSPGNLNGLPLCESGSLTGAWVSASAATSPHPPCCGNIGYGFPLQRHLPQLFPNYLSDSTSNSLRNAWCANRSGQCSCTGTDGLGFADLLQWQPRGCRLTQWNATRFCEALTVDSDGMLIIGDSTAHQFQGAVKRRVEFDHWLAGRSEAARACIERIGFAESDTLVGLNLGNFNRGPRWDSSVASALAGRSRSFPGRTPRRLWVVLSAGPHVQTMANYSLLLEAVNSTRARFGDSIRLLWKLTSSAGGCTASRPLTAPPDAAFYDEQAAQRPIFHWPLLPRFDDVAREFWARAGVGVVDLQPLHLRTDAHPSSGANSPAVRNWAAPRPQGDCLHFCMQGPLDHLAPQLLLHAMVARDS